MNELQRIKEWFEIATPNPTEAQKSIQLGVHMEEFAEMLYAIDLPDYASDIDLIGTGFKTGYDEFLNLNIDKTELLDSLVDQIVTAIGVAHMFGFDVEGAIKEVNRSNYSKFEDGSPVFNEHGKIAKGKNYTPPNLNPFIGE